MKDMQIEMRSSQSGKVVGKTLVKDWMLYILLVPMIVWFILFIYKPMGGIVLAFKEFNADAGIFGSDFVGFKYMLDLVAGSYKVEFWQAFRNTFIISLYGLLFGFPVPIILALLFSEINNNSFRKITQTITYLPYFLSEVTITGIVLTLIYSGSSSTGVVAWFLDWIGLVSISDGPMIENPAYFRPLYIITGIWKESGYNSIVYFAAIMGIAPAMYEALKVDGGSKWQEIRYVTIPGMAPTLIIMIIMRIGRMLSVGYERVLLLYDVSTYEVADVLSTFEQRMIGAAGGAANYEIGAAAGIFNAVIGFALVVGANTISRKVSSTSLW